MTESTLMDTNALDAMLVGTGPLADDPAVAVPPLARWAIAQQTGIYQRYRDEVGQPEERLPGALLSNRVSMSREMGRTESAAWLALLASAPDASVYGDLVALTCSDHERRAAQRDTWRPVGLLGPLAYAAGLDPVEALERHAVGTLDEAQLRLLAGLRGYRFPRTEA
jgi:hypothetical protein